LQSNNGITAEADRLAPPSARFCVGAAILCWYLAMQLAYLSYGSPIRALDISLLVVSLVALWRYSWWFNHARRARRYGRRFFPRLRARADALSGERPPHLCVLVTSYRTQAPVSWTVYRSLIAELVAYGAPATLLASVSDPADEFLIRRCAGEVDPGGHVNIIVQFQDGSGKRVAIAEGLRALSRQVSDEDALLVLMDGDTRVPPDTLRRTAPFFFADPELGALTLDNKAYSDGGVWSREWYELRLAQRHLLMQSMALSDRVLVLTGRFSMFRARLALRPDFIDQVERDSIQNWRLGRIDFLTGDDKSTWFWLLKNGWKMLYVPDVCVDNIEIAPSAGFLRSSVQLMHRWFGNMLRVNGRAIALGPRRMGLFTWWCIVDQRLSMWTTLVGPASVIWMTIAGWTHVVFAYLAWITVTRTIAALVISRQRRRFSPFYIPLLYFQQIVGAAMKIHLSFRLNQQRWTRQKTGQRQGGASGTGNRDVAAAMMQAVSVVAFFLAVGLALDVAGLPRGSAIRAAAAALTSDQPAGHGQSVFPPAYALPQPAQPLGMLEPN